MLVSMDNCYSWNIIIKGKRENKTVWPNEICFAEEQEKEEEDDEDEKHHVNRISSMRKMKMIERKC